MSIWSWEETSKNFTTMFLHKFGKQRTQIGQICGHFNKFCFQFIIIPHLYLYWIFGKWQGGGDGDRWIKRPWPNRKYHEKTEHSDHEKPFKCNECTNSFSSLIGLKHHKRNHNITPNEYSCETCRKIFSAESTLKRHIKSVHCNESKEKFQCDVCDKLFTRADNLTGHTHEAHKEPSLNTQYIRQFAKPFKCDYCESRYSRKDKLVEPVEPV